MKTWHGYLPRYHVVMLSTLSVVADQLLKSICVLVWLKVLNIWQKCSLLLFSDNVYFRLLLHYSSDCAFTALTLLVGCQEEHPACKTEWWGAGVVICLEWGADSLKLVTVSQDARTRLTALFPGLPEWEMQNQSGFYWNETVIGSCISWAICKSAPRSRQITMPAPHHSVFYRSDALPATQPTASKALKAFHEIVHTCIQTLDNAHSSQALSLITR